MVAIQCMVETVYIKFPQLKHKVLLSLFGILETCNKANNMSVKNMFETSTECQHGQGWEANGINK